MSRLNSCLITMCCIKSARNTHSNCTIFHGDSLVTIHSLYFACLIIIAYYQRYLYRYLISEAKINRNKASPLHFQDLSKGGGGFLIFWAYWVLGDHFSVVYSWWSTSTLFSDYFLMFSPHKRAKGGYYPENHDSLGIYTYLSASL